MSHFQILSVARKIFHEEHSFMNNESRSKYIKLIAQTSEPKQLNLINGLPRSVVRQNDVIHCKSSSYSVLYIVKVVEETNCIN